VSYLDLLGRLRDFVEGRLPITHAPLTRAEAAAIVEALEGVEPPARCVCGKPASCQARQVRALYDPRWFCTTCLLGAVDAQGPHQVERLTKPLKLGDQPAEDPHEPDEMGSA